jgi:ubiquinone/menaquinone biosynthesis C-methylase UbiE/uncharacterized protein YbaR (Trm112 family)
MAKISPYVQEMIAGTNGNHYLDLVGQLKEYPIPEIPIPNVTHQELLLDIGVGWGRWMVAAAQKGYMPIGIDIKRESCEAALTVLKDMQLKGYTVVADLQAIPFKDEVFDKVWSFSVIQHTHRKRAYNCLKEINRTLKNGGSCKLEFPLKHGLWNSRVIAKRDRTENEDDFDSWIVRYYDITELKAWSEEIFTNFSFQNHCYFGIGILPIDLQYIKWYYKPIVLASLMLSQISKIVSPLKYISDSIYIEMTKTIATSTTNTTLKDTTDFWKKTDRNVDIVHLLRCPISGKNLVYDNDQNRVVAEHTGLYYPVVNDIPIMLVSEAKNI